MKFAISAVALVFAAFTTAQYNNQSAPFNLVLLSEDPSLNGSTLTACHEGAAIESLCRYRSMTGNLDAGVFQFNTSDQSIVPNATLGAPGYVTFLLRGSNFNSSEPLGLYANPTTNVALPLFYPSYNTATVMAFDANNLLNIQGYIDDSKTPAAVGPWTAYYRWYSCSTYYSGYTYSTLSWIYGDGKPQNPSCVKVTVKRVFV